MPMYIWSNAIFKMIILAYVSMGQYTAHYAFDKTVCHGY